MLVRKQRDVADVPPQQRPHNLLHHRLAQPLPLEVGVHQHVPYRGVEGVVARGAAEPDERLAGSVRLARHQVQAGHQEAVAQRLLHLGNGAPRPAHLVAETFKRVGVHREANAIDDGCVVAFLIGRLDKAYLLVVQDARLLPLLQERGLRRGRLYGGEHATGARIGSPQPEQVRQEAAAPVACCRGSPSAPRPAARRGPRSPRRLATVAPCTAPHPGRRARGVNSTDGGREGRHRDGGQWRWRWRWRCRWRQ
mmetsp:Transcript_12720/g.32754  ORF Transcript_12720/g.32754 Transcript_12720/m.32754 type:complete len:252 (+) Transcript_12720:432-1187(+)